MIKNKAIRFVINALMLVFAFIILFNYGIYGINQLYTGNMTYMPLICSIILITVLPIVALRLFGKKIGRCADILQIIFVVGMGVYCVSFVAMCVYTMHGVRYTTEESFDAVMVYGAKVNGNTPSLSLTERLDKALELYEKNPRAYVIVSGGKGRGEDISEAECMKQYLIEHGVGGSAIICEDKSTNTRENVQYTKKLLEDMGLEKLKIVGVSSEFHVKRILGICSDYGLESDCIGSHTSSLPRLYVSLVREYMSNIKYMLGL